MSSPRPPREPGDEPPPYGLEQYAREKELPPDWLAEEFQMRTHRGREVAIPYHDAEGRPVFEKYRAGDGRFRAGKGAELIPYGLDRLDDDGGTVLIVEGESDVHTCAHHGVAAVGIPGARNWKPVWTEYLDGRDILVWEEPDDAGAAMVRALAEDLPDARVIEAPEDAKDPSDLHLADSNAFRDRLTRLIKDARPISEVVEELPEPEDGDDDHQKDSQKAKILGIADDLELFHDERDEGYVRLEQDGHRETWRLRGARFKSWLAYKFFEREGTAPSASVLNDALQVMTGRALFEGPTRPLANRLTWDDDRALWYDLTDEAWRVVRIVPGEWELVEEPPPLFRRYAHQAAQVEPDPIPAEALPDLMGPFLNLPEGSRERRLLYVWLPAALVAEVPRPVLVPHGPQGAGKSVLTRMLRALVDPSEVPIPSFPESRRDLAQALDHNAMTALDNVSKLSRSLSDTLCRAVTGGGFTKRRLYTDEDDVLFKFCRAVILNGINVAATRPDLLDRCLLVELDRIDPEEQTPERGLRKHFRALRPQIFGAMLDALARAMEIEPGLGFKSLPRMADWTRWAYAVAEAVGIGGDQFLEDYAGNRAARNEEALASHPVGSAILRFMRGRSEWIGTVTWLLEELEDVATREGIDTTQRRWPGSSHWLTRRINEVTPNLEDAGIRWEPEWKWDPEVGKLARLTRTAALGRENREPEG